VAVWTAAMTLALAAAGAARLIDRFTRFCGETFGMLIAVLFLQQGVKVRGPARRPRPPAGWQIRAAAGRRGTISKPLPPSNPSPKPAARQGLVQEFRPDELAPPGGAAQAFPFPLINGLWGLVVAAGLLASALAATRARAWRVLTPGLRGWVADYGAPAAVVLWTAISFALDTTPAGVPRRVATPNTWETGPTWAVARRMGDVPGRRARGGSAAPLHAPPLHPPRRSDALPPRRCLRFA